MYLSEQKLLWCGQTPQTKALEWTWECINETLEETELMRDWLLMASAGCLPIHYLVLLYILSCPLGMSGRAGLLISLCDHYSPLSSCHCVRSLFIKIGLNGLLQGPHLWTEIEARQM